MIAKLTGRVDCLLDDGAIIDVRGVGYRVQCPSRVLGALAPGAAVELWIETVVREDAFLLYGFTHRADQDWFRLLTGVQGVGTKAALAILGVLDADGLMRAVAAGDKAAVSRANGVGPKLAGRVVSELKDKAGGIALGAAAKMGVALPAAAAAPAPGATAEATSALV
ncbi:MAG: Holliday junction branch migration protein RuvA, partial [Rhodobacterales bacterium]|nr:Holliday junction branch migration protein RuvA [Rhodobacterales bacterium]